MTNDDIDQFFVDLSLRAEVEAIDRPPNRIWLFQTGRFPAFIQTQAEANRMRVVVTIAQNPVLDEAEYIRLMEANFHSALDARYALSDGDLVSLYLHPLAELSKTQFVLGLFQTVSLAYTCGSEYSSGLMSFGASGGGVAHSIETEALQMAHELGRLIRGE